MSKNQIVHQLPKGYTNRFIHVVDGLSLGSVLIISMLLYVAIAVLCTGILQISSWAGIHSIYSNGAPVSSFGDILYFNFITILTVGYGDMQPVGLGRFVAAVEALLGVGLFGGIIGVVVLKLTQPKKNSIVFSRHAYYAIDEERFFIMFVNTSNAQLVNAQISYSINLGHHNEVKPSKTSPYVSDSVWILNLSKYTLADLQCIELYPDDGLKFAISGTYGFTNFATAVKYEMDQILAVPSRGPLERELLLSNPKFGSTQFERVFHYNPQGAIPFLTYAQQCGASANPEMTNRATELTRIGLRLPQHRSTINGDEETVIFKKN